MFTEKCYVESPRTRAPESPRARALVWQYIVFHDIISKSTTIRKMSICWPLRIKQAHLYPLLSFLVCKKSNTIQHPRCTAAIHLDCQGIKKKLVGDWQMIGPLLFGSQSSGVWLQQSGCMEANGLSSSGFWQKGCFLHVKPIPSSSLQKAKSSEVPNLSWYLPPDGSDVNLIHQVDVDFNCQPGPQEIPVDVHLNI